MASPVNIFHKLSQDKNLNTFGELELHNFSFFYTESQPTRKKFLLPNHLWGDTFIHISGMTLPSISNEFKELVKEQYDLSDTELLEVDRQYKSYILELPYKIIDAKSASVLFDGCFSSTRRISDELISLLDEVEDKDEFIEVFKKLQQFSIKYSSFQTDMTEKHEIFSQLITMLESSKTLKKNLPFFYNNIACRKKNSNFGMFVKKTLASMLRASLRLLVSLPAWAITIPLKFYFLAFPVTIIVAPIYFCLNLTLAAITIVNALTVATITLASILGFVFAPFALNAIEYLLSPIYESISQAIDNFVESIFDVKLNELSITDVIDLNKNQSSTKQSASFTNGFFGQPAPVDEPVVDQPNQAPALLP